MKKLAVVLGVAAVATLTGCRDQDYDARHGKQVQNEPKSIETVPAQPVAQPAESTPAPARTIAPVEVRCTCPPGTKHAKPCGCGASDCACVVEKPVVKPVEPEYTIYIVQNGDYLAKISKKYNVTINSIKRLNGLKSDSVRVGQKLKLPGKIDVGVQEAPVKPSVKASGKASSKKGFVPFTGATKEYVVKNGDTLGSVAYGNGLNIRQLKQLNNLTGDSLKIGQKLKVPVDKKAAKAQTASKAPAAAAPKSVEAKAAPAAAAPAATPAEAAPAAPAAPAADAPAADAVAPAADAPKASAEAASASAEEKPAAPATTSYVVQEGEDLTRIAVDFGVTTSQIRELNNLGENDVVKPGQVLKLPAEPQQ